MAKNNNILKKNISYENNYNNYNDNVLTIKTVQIAPFRILMTALKDILLDTNITIASIYYVTTSFAFKHLFIKLYG